MRISGIILLFLFCLLFLVTCEDEELQSPVVSTEPILTITAPVEDQAVADYITIKVNATDDIGVAKVEFYFDSELKTFDPTEPYECNINIRNYPHGVEHTLYAVAYDTDDNSTGSSVVKVIVDTSIAAPKVSELSLGEIGANFISVVWSKNDEPDFRRYELFADKFEDFDSIQPLENITSVNDTVFQFDDLFDNTSYRVQIAVVDSSDNYSFSNQLEVTTGDIAPPQIDILRIVNWPEFKSIHWQEVNFHDFYAYEIVKSTDSVYDSGDEVIVTINEQETYFYNYYTTEQLNCYFFLVVSDISQNKTVSEYYYLNASEEINYALDFDGIRHVTVPFVPELNLGDQYTLEAWVYQRNQGVYDRVIDKGPAGSPYFQYSLISATTLKSDLCKDGGPGRYSASYGISLNTWHHIALTYDYGVLKFYIDGDSIGTVSTNTNSVCDFETNLNIGRRELYDEFHFRGIIDEVRVWNVTRSTSEIQAAMNNYLTGSESGLVLYFNFNEGVGNSLTSPTGINGYLGESPDNDLRDPVWTLEAAPVE